MDFAMRTISRKAYDVKNGHVVLVHKKKEGGKLKPCYEVCRKNRKYSDLTWHEKEMLSERAQDVLMPRNSFLSLLCLGQRKPEKRAVEPVAMALIEYLIKHGPETKYIFRREGIKSVYIGLAHKLEKNEGFDFSAHSVRDLASALKHYIREMLNGLFDHRLLGKIMGALVRKDTVEARRLCCHLVFSLDDLQRSCLAKLKELFTAVDRNYAKTEINWESISSILALTLTPQESFKEVQSVKHAVAFFKVLMDIDPYHEVVDSFL